MHRTTDNVTMSRLDRWLTMLCEAVETDPNETTED